MNEENGIFIIILKVKILVNYTAYQVEIALLQLMSLWLGYIIVFFSRQKCMTTCHTTKLYKWVDILSVRVNGM